MASYKPQEFTTWAGNIYDVIKKKLPQPYDVSFGTSCDVNFDANRYPPLPYRPTRKLASNARAVEQRLQHPSHQATHLRRPVPRDACTAGVARARSVWFFA